MLRIDRLTSPPLVGRYYLVPTVRYNWRDVVDDWPVMGPKHEDAEHLQFPWPHYHVDVRFLTKTQVDRLVGTPFYEDFYIVHIVGQFPLLRHPVPRDRDIIEPHPNPVWRRRRCQRESHSYPLKEFLRMSRGNFKRLHKAFEGRACGQDAEGRTICPHKGFVLDSLPQDDDGRVVCPLHGLTIDMRRKVVVKPNF